ncbi:hypothetical protein PCANC_20605 [Puccinia coronata f. sp. avenae]|uniref:Uncharacterized protein n=1 Tax=Puccinia coronata f. sp. avenae TaxID=200324 RepID=A0A2N5T4V9_9BASI|nr:hypothetical protein PCANC_20605 [Puccinia coronata f. sp. avenae]
MSLPWRLVEFSACHNLERISLALPTPLPRPDVGTPQTGDSAAQYKELQLLSLSKSLIEFSASQNLERISFALPTPFPQPLADSSPLDSSPDVGAPQTGDSAGQIRLLSLGKFATDRSLEQLKEIFHSAMAKELYTRGLDRSSVKSGIFLAPDLMDMKMGITINKKGKIIKGPFNIVEQEHFLICCGLLSKATPDVPCLVYLAAEADMLTRPELTNALPVQLRKELYKRGMVKCTEGSGTFATLDGFEIRTGLLVDKDVTPKLSDKPLSNVQVKLAEQIFNQLAKKHGFGDLFQLQYVNSLDSLVPADAFTQEIQAQFPSLDVKSFL